MLEQLYISYVYVRQDWRKHPYIFSPADVGAVAKQLSSGHLSPFVIGATICASLSQAGKQVLLSSIQKQHIIATYI